MSHTQQSTFSEMPSVFAAVANAAPAQIVRRLRLCDDVEERLIMAVIVRAPLFGGAGLER